MPVLHKIRTLFIAAIQLHEHILVTTYNKSTLINRTLTLGNAVISIM